MEWSQRHPLVVILLFIAGTCMVAAIAIGISVDDTIHFMTRYKAEMRRLQDRRRAIESVLHSEALPVISTSLSLMLGFAIMVMSHLTPILLTSFQLTNVPELLYLKLQKELAGSPLFTGMTTYQIKKFILLGRVEERKPGEYIIKTGEWLIERQSHPDYSNSTQGRRYFTSSLLGSFLFRINEISFYLNAQYEFDKAGFLFGAWREFELEMFKFNIGLQYFPDSPSTSSYFNWRHNDRIVGSITYSFQPFSVEPEQLTPDALDSQLRSR